MPSFIKIQLKIHLSTYLLKRFNNSAYYSRHCICFSVQNLKKIGSGHENSLIDIHPSMSK